MRRLIDAFDNIVAQAQSFRLEAEAFRKEGGKEEALALIMQALGLEKALDIIVRAFEHEPVADTLKQTQLWHFDAIERVFGHDSQGLTRPKTSWHTMLNRLGSGN